MRICPTCEKTFDDETKFCPDDGTPLKAQQQSSDPMMGRRLMDRWEVIDRIGAGGFGTVYKVRDLRFDYVEALKVFDRRRLNPEEVDEAVARFRREAMLLKRLGNLSQNIVGVSNMEDDEEGGFIYFTMEYVAGENISQILVREGAIPPDRVVAITKQICKALSVAHNYEEGIVHRDMKLENVMITRDKNDKEVVKILDFGIAKAIGQQSLTNLTMGGPGTPGYAAPEQVEGREIDQRTDLFALGVVIYGMLTGREPWLGGFITEPSSGGWTLLKQTVDGDPIPAHRWDPEVPKALEDIVFKLLEKDPDNRFQSAEDVLEALEAFESGKAVPVPARGTLRVVSPEPGVAIRVKQGVFKTVAEGRTPWEAESLEPGSYTIQVRDDRYEKESRDVEVVAEGAVEINLTAARLEDTRERPGSLLVTTPEEGVRVRLRSGFKSMGEGTTPWSASSLPPGDYKIEIVDDRFARTSRSVRILPEEETSVELSVHDKSDVPVWKRVTQSPVPLGIATVGVVAAVYFAVFGGGGGARMDYEDFTEQYLEGNPEAIQSYQVTGDELNPTVQTADGPVIYRVPLEGAPLQETVRRLGAAGASLFARGEGSAIFEPSFGEGGPEVPVRFTLRPAEGGEGGCTDCAAGEVIEGLEPGWFQVAENSEEWDADSVVVADPEGVYQEEGLGQDRTVFIPEDGRIAVRFSLVPTELGRTLGSAQADLHRGTRESLAAALSWLAGAFELDADNPTAQALSDSIAMAYVDLGRKALEQGNEESVILAGSLAGDCRNVPGGEREICGTLLADAQTQLAALDQRQRAAEAEAAGEPAPTQQAEVVATGPSQTEQLVRQAESALSAGNLDDARQAVERCLIFDSGAAECVRLETRVATAYLTRARQRLQSGDLAAAETAIGQCLNLDGGNADCVQVRASLSLRRGQQSVRSGDLQAALTQAQACRRDARGGSPDCGSLVEDIADEYFVQARTALQEGRLPAAQTAVDQCRSADANHADCGRVRQALTDLTSAGRELRARNFDGARRLAQQCLSEFPDASPCSAIVTQAQEAQAEAARSEPEPTRTEPEPRTPPTPSGPTVTNLSLTFGATSDRRNVTIQPTFSAARATGQLCLLTTYVSPQNDSYRQTIRHEMSASNGQQSPTVTFDPSANETYLSRSTNQGDVAWNVTAAVYGSACGSAPEEAGQGSPLAQWQGQACYNLTFGGEWFSQECGG